MLFRLILMIVLLIVIVWLLLIQLESNVFQPSVFLTQPFREMTSFTLKPQDGKHELDVWYYDRDHHFTLLFFHGTTGNMGHRRYALDLAKLMKMNLMMVDYRGYGRSTGRPSFKGLCDDGNLTYDFLRAKVSPDRIIIWGESIGGAVGMDVASKNPCHHLFLMSTFGRIDDVIESFHFNPVIAGPLGMFVWNCSKAMDNLCKADQLRCSVCLIHSIEDELIPYHRAVTLYDRIPTRKRLVTIRGLHAAPIISLFDLQQIMSTVNITCPDSTRVTHLLRSIRLISAAIEAEKLRG